MLSSKGPDANVGGSGNMGTFGILADLGRGMERRHEIP
jgi:hypothetical protein